MMHVLTAVTPIYNSAPHVGQGGHHTVHTHNTAKKRRGLARPRCIPPQMAEITSDAFVDSLLADTLDALEDVSLPLPDLPNPPPPTLPSLPDIAAFLRGELNMREPSMANGTTSSIIERACMELEISPQGKTLLAQARACWQALGAPPLGVFSPPPPMSTTLVAPEVGCAAPLLLPSTGGIGTIGGMAAPMMWASAVPIGAPPPPAALAGNLSALNINELQDLSARLKLEIRARQHELKEATQSQPPPTGEQGAAGGGRDHDAVSAPASTISSAPAAAQHGAPPLPALPGADEDGNDDSLPVEGDMLPRPCTRCRTSRVLCDRKHPCSRCVRLGYECTVPESVRRGRPPGSKGRKQGRHAANADTFIAAAAAFAAGEDAEDFEDDAEDGVTSEIRSFLGGGAPHDESSDANNSRGRQATGETHAISATGEQARQRQSKSSSPDKPQNAETSGSALVWPAPSAPSLGWEPMQESMSELLISGLLDHGNANAARPSTARADPQAAAAPSAPSAENHKGAPAAGAAKTVLSALRERRTERAEERRRDGEEERAEGQGGRVRTWNSDDEEGGENGAAERRTSRGLQTQDSAVPLTSQE